MTQSGHSLVQQPLLRVPNLLSFEPNWRRLRPHRGGRVRRRDFIKVIASLSAALIRAARAYELVINRKAAKPLGLSLPTSLIARANELID